jgi:hypothetical protein
MPTKIPGVVTPWRQRSADMTENAPPTSTARASLRTAPAIVSVTAAATADAAAAATSPKCIAR